MGWSPAEISLVVVEMLAAMALAVLWFGDRERSYTLWWAVSHAMQPMPPLLIAFANAQDNPGVAVAIVLCFTNATQSVALMAGVISYRATRFRLRPHHVLQAILALVALFLLLLVLRDKHSVRLAMVSSMAVSLLASAALMWSLGWFEKVAAFCFALRGTLELGLLSLSILGDHDSSWFNHFLGFHALIAITTILALLLAAYQRSLKRLRDQYRFLELSQQISAELQGVTDETSLAERVLKILMKRMDWEHGGFFRQSDGVPGTFVLIASDGEEYAGQLQSRQEFSPPSDGMIAAAVRTRRVCHSENLLEDTRVKDGFRQHPFVKGNLTLAVIPVTHHATVFGVIVLHDSKQREIREAEIRTLESLGQVVGISVANARNLRELAHRANHDTLTGLGNRAALHDYLNNRTIENYAVMLFDLDRFKQVNDALGHSVGDNLLRAMAQRLREYLEGKPAHLFRLGGDEFVIIHTLGSGDRNADVLELSRNLGKVIAQPLQIGELSLRMSASIGVAMAPQHGDNSHELLRCADVAMYHAKHRGSGTVLYQREIDAYKLEDLTLLSAVNEGLEKEQFTLYYQPIVNAGTGVIETCEGLIRWHHPTRGLVEATDFMPLIETTDLIRQLTHRVVEIGMAEVADWRRRGIGYRLAINLSARNVLDPELPGYLLDMARRYAVDPEGVQLEITETILIKDPDSAGEVLAQLAEAGFSLALDDFGTGYSSMAYLARFPIHTLKIDRSFVHAMLDHAQSRAIVETTIALARGLGMKVTAEGVESEGEALLLKELGCDHVQGYLYGKPVSATELLARCWPQASAQMS